MAEISEARVTAGARPGRLDGKVALVTGAGSGIGRAAAVRFAAEGASICALDRDLDSAQGTAELAGGGLALAADVAEARELRRAVGEVVERFGRLDVLFNNAGVAQSATPFEEISTDDWDRIMRVNLTGFFVCARAVVPAMRDSGGGSIVLTSSIAAVHPRPGISAYVASKAGASGLMRALALELAPARIRVNAIAPVAVRTPMLVQFGFGSDEAATIERVEQTIPLGHVIEPDDVAAAALYLASDESRAVTGITLNVDGGRDL